MFTRAAAGQRNSSGAGGTGKGVRFGRWASRVRGLPEAYGELPVGGAGGGDRHAGRGPDPRAGDDRRQPARLDAQLRAAHARGRGARVHARHRHLRQRDDPPRGRDPARARAAREVALRHRALPARGPQRGALLAAGVRALDAAGVADVPAPRGHRRGPGRARGRRRARLDGGPDADPARALEPGLARGGPRRRRAARGARAAPRPGAHHRPDAARRALRRRASAPIPRG